MSLNQARLAALCSLLMFLFAVGTAWIWWRAVAITVPPKGTLMQSNHFTTLPHRQSTTTIKQLAVVQEIKKTIKQDTSTTTVKKAAVDLPEEFLLDVPFISQAPEKNWDQPWQDACEEAAALMMDAYYKGYSLSLLFAKDEILKMVAWEEEKEWGLSIEAEKVKEIFEQYLGLAPKKTIRIVENPTVKQIKQFIADGTPVYVVADGKALPNPHFQNGGPEYHALVIKGYNETEFITNDPGTQYGEGFTYTYDDLMNAIHDWNDGNVGNGRRVVLVIE